MTKTEIVDNMAQEAGITKAQATKALDAFVASLKQGVKKEGKFAISGVGTWKKTLRKARTGTTSLGGATKEWSVPAHNTVTFKASPQLKEAVN